MPTATYELPIDHSFLTYKKELIEYGYKVGKISMKEQIFNVIKKNFGIGRFILN